MKNIRIKLLIRFLELGYTQVQGKGKVIIYFQVNKVSHMENNICTV
jgi:hypothetical protein